MSELMGCDAIEFGVMKKQMISRPQIKEDMIQVIFTKLLISKLKIFIQFQMIQLFNNRLIEIKCFMKLSFAKSEYPTITELIESTQPLQAVLSAKAMQERISSNYQ